MNRQDLINTLDVVGRALERNNVLPIYEFFCFTGETVFAFSDAFGVVGKCKVKTPFGVHGPTTLGLLKASKSKDVEIKLTKDNHVQIIAGTSEYKLPYKTPDEFAWKEPEFEADTYGESILAAIESCLTTCSPDLALEAFNRVNITEYQGNIAVYATDGDALTRYVTNIKAASKVDICLSRDFCDAIIKIGLGGHLQVGKEWVCLITEDFKVYGHNLGPSTLKYEDEIAKVGADNSKGFAAIPIKELDEALTRARVVADIETSPTTLIIEN